MKVNKTLRVLLHIIFGFNQKNGICNQQYTQ